MESMVRDRSTAAACLAAALLLAGGVSPAAATERPFEVLVSDTAIEVGPGEDRGVSVQVDRNTETSTECLGDGGTIQTCQTGPVTLSLAGAPPGVTACFDGTPAGCVTSASEAIGGFRISVTEGARPGSYTLRVTGTARDGPEPRSHSVALTLTVPPFSVLAPDALTVQAGDGVTAEVQIRRTSGFTAGVDLRVVPPDPALGITATLSGTATDVARTLTLALPPGVPPGRHPLAVVASGDGASRAKELVLTVPSFTLALEPTGITTVSGQRASATVTLTPDPGLTRPIDLSLVTPHPGISGVFGGVPVSRGVRTLTLDVGRGVPAGRYDLTVRGASGSATGSASLRLMVKPFLLTVSEPLVTLFPGAPATGVTVGVVRSAGFTSAVDLSLDGVPAGTAPGAGLGGSFRPDPTTGGASTLTLRAGRFARPADLPLTVSATGGGVREAVPLLVEILESGLP